MPATDTLLFIDANKYLDLYRTDKGRKLLAPLTEQAEYVFVTQQIVNEVERNKLGVAAEFLRKKSQGMKLQGINVPDHFSGSEAGKNQEILTQMKDISKSVSIVNSEIDKHTLKIMAQVAESKDEVSTDLSPIFSKAISATPDELIRARERKEVGNPPGKRNDPLGDEITWEQIISHFEGKKRLWIISRDGDYGTSFGGELFLNGLLRSELDRITESARVYIFQDLVEGLTHFVETTKVKAEIKLTPEEVIEIEEEEKSLPPVEVLNGMSPLTESTQATTAKIHQALAAIQRPYTEMQKAISMTQLPTSGIQSAMAAIEKSNAEFQKALALTQSPTSGIQSAMAAIEKSNAEFQNAIALTQPSTSGIQSAMAAIQQSSAEIQKAVSIAQQSSSEMPKTEND